MGGNVVQGIRDQKGFYMCPAMRKGAELRTLRTARVCDKGEQVTRSK